MQAQVWARRRQSFRLLLGGGPRQPLRPRRASGCCLSHVPLLQLEEDGPSHTSPTFGGAQQQQKEEEEEEEEKDLSKALRVERFEEILQDSHSRNVEEAGRSYSEKDFECMLEPLGGGGLLGRGSNNLGGERQKL